MITLPFPERDNKAPLAVSWDDACVPGRAQNCMQRRESSISTSLEKFSMDATNPWSFTPISTSSPQPVFPQRKVDASTKFCPKHNHKVNCLKMHLWVHFLPQPPKVDGGYIFTLVCLSRCEQDISKCYRQNEICMKLGGLLGCVTRENQWEFWIDLDPDTKILM